MYYVHVTSTLHTIDVATVSPLNDKIIREGNTTTITCEAFGYPPPTVVWNRVDGILSDRVSMSNNVVVTTGNGNITRVSVNLTITNASREDTAVYTCSANNTIGSDSTNVSITVQCKLQYIYIYIYIYIYLYICIYIGTL